MIILIRRYVKTIFRVLGNHIFNYSLKTPSDIRKIYDNGPVESQSFLQKFGIPNLGLRNPIYNVEDTCN